MWGIAVNDFPLISLTVLWLVFLEGLLSADNALVLAVMVRHLPPDQQKRALRYGMGGAFAFRLIAVGLARVLLAFWFPKVLGGLYLLYLTVSHFLSPDDDDEAKAGRFGKGLWMTILYVELADIAFSIDSILAAVATADGMPERISVNTKFAIVLTGGVLGIITMRFVAGYFIILLDRFKGLEAGAYGLVAWIGLKLVTGGLHDAKAIPYEMNDLTFWLGMLAILLVSFVYKPPVRPKAEETTAQATAIAEEVTRIASGAQDAETA